MTVFSKFDIKSGFWEIQIAEQDRYKTIYITSELPSMRAPDRGKMSTPIDVEEEQRGPLLQEDDIVPSSSSNSPDASTPSPANPNPRLASLDVFRGLTVAVRSRRNFSDPVCIYFLVLPKNCCVFRFAWKLFER